jgi:hypothetical protein
MWFLQLLGIIPKALDLADNWRKDIANERVVLINAKTTKEKQESLERIQQLEMQAATQIAEAQPNASPWGARFRFIGFGLPAGLAIWKLLVWDKVLGSFAGCTHQPLPTGCHYFRTDSFDPNLWWVVLAAAGFYLVTSKR